MTGLLLRPSRCTLCRKRYIRSVQQVFGGRNESLLRLRKCLDSGFFSAKVSIRILILADRKTCCSVRSHFFSSTMTLMVFSLGVLHPLCDSSKYQS